MSSESNCPPSVPPTLWEATIGMPSHVRHQVRSFLAEHERTLAELAREREARERLDRELHEALAMPVLAEERVRELGADRKIALDALGKIAGGQDYGQPRRFARQVIEAQGWAEALVGLPE